jgi:hypothetical protein
LGDSNAGAIASFSGEQHMADTGADIAEVSNPPADSQMPADIRNMIQQNFESALAQNQQLMEIVQRQMDQDTQYSNALQGLFQAISQGPARTATE